MASAVCPPSEPALLRSPPSPKFAASASTASTFSFAQSTPADAIPAAAPAVTVSSNEPRASFSTGAAGSMGAATPVFASEASSVGAAAPVLTAAAFPGADVADKGGLSPAAAVARAADIAAKGRLREPPPFAEYEQRQKGQLQRAKKGGWCGGKWPLEFFVVSTEFLVSFSSQTSHHVEFCIPLGAIQEATARTKPRDPFLFAVRFATGLGSAPGDKSDELILRAEDAKELQSWIAAINKASERRRHYFVPLVEARERVVDLQNQEIELSERLHGSEAHAAHLESHSAQLESQMVQLQSQCADLEARYSTLQESSALAAQSQCADLEGRYSTLQEGSALAAERAAMQVEDLRSQVTSSRQVTPPDCPAMEKRNLDDIHQLGSPSKASSSLLRDTSNMVEVIRQPLHDAPREVAAQPRLAAGSSLDGCGEKSDSRAGAIWLFASLARCQSMALQLGFSQLKRCQSDAEVGEERSEEVKTTCRKAATRIFVQLSSLKRASRLDAFATWRLQAARFSGQEACISAGVSRVEWACHRLSRRALVQSFASLRPDPLPEAPLQNLATLQNALVGNCLRSGFFTWRLRAAVPPSLRLEACRSIHTQTEKPSSNSLVLQGPASVLSKGKKGKGNQILLDEEFCGVEAEELDCVSSPSRTLAVLDEGASDARPKELEGCERDLSLGEGTLNPHEAGFSLHRSENLDGLSEHSDSDSCSSGPASVSSKTIATPTLLEKDMRGRQTQVADCFKSPEIKLAVLDSAASAPSELEGYEGALPLGHADSDSSSSSVSSSPSSPKASPGSPAAAKQRLDSQSMPPLNLSQLQEQLESQLERASSGLSSVRSGLEQVSRSVSRASSRTPSRVASPREESVSDVFAASLGEDAEEELQMEEKELEQPAPAEGEEKCAFEQRWWRALAEVATDTDSPLVRRGNAPAASQAHMRGGQRNDGGTGSSYDDGISSTYDSSGGSADTAAAQSPTHDHKAIAKIVKSNGLHSGGGTGGLSRIFAPAHRQGAGHSHSSTPSSARLASAAVRTCSLPARPTSFPPVSATLTLARPVSFPPASAAQRLAGAAVKSPPATPPATPPGMPRSLRPVPRSPMRSLPPPPIRR